MSKSPSDPVAGQFIPFPGYAGSRVLGIRELPLPDTESLAIRARAYFAEDVHYGDGVLHRVSNRQLRLEGAQILGGLLYDFTAAICHLGPSLLERPGYSGIARPSTPRAGPWGMPPFARLDLGMGAGIYEVDNNIGAWGVVLQQQRFFGDPGAPDVGRLFRELMPRGKPLMVLDRIRTQYLRESEYFMAAVGGEVARIEELEVGEEGVVFRGRSPDWVHRRFDFDLPRSPTAGILGLWRSGRLPVLPDPAPVYSKIWLAALWDPELADDLAAHLDLAALRRLVPETRLLAGEDAGLGPERRHWVIKILTPEKDARGEGVTFGDRTSSVKWQNHVREILASGWPAIIQRACLPGYLHLPWYDPETDATGVERLSVMLRPHYFFTAEGPVYAGGVYTARTQRRSLSATRDAVIGVIV